MNSPRILTIATLAVTLSSTSLLLFAQSDAASAKSASSDKAADKTSDKAAAKPPEKPLPPDSTTQGSVDVAGQRLAYTAIAGTITVGSTDVQDAQLGMDGKPLPGSQLAASDPKDGKDADS